MNPEENRIAKFEKELIQAATNYAVKLAAKMAEMDERPRCAGSETSEDRAKRSEALHAFNNGEGTASGLTKEDLSNAKYSIGTPEGENWHKPETVGGLGYGKQARCEIEELKAHVRNLVKVATKRGAEIEQLERQLEDRHSPKTVGGADYVRQIEAANKALRDRILTFEHIVAEREKTLAAKNDRIYHYGCSIRAMEKELCVMKKKSLSTLVGELEARVEGVRGANKDLASAAIKEH